MQILDLRQIKIRPIAIQRNPDIEKRLILVLIIMALFLAISYGYFVKQTILNVVNRKNLEESIANLGSEVSILEVQYIGLKNKIDLDYAYSLGYSDTEDIKFISRSQMDKVLTLKGQ